MFNRDPKICVKYGLFFNSVAVTYTDYDTEVIIPQYEASDGPTLNWLTRIFFSNREYVMGAEAALVHDYMCRHKELYSRRVSSKMLRDIWISCGLNKIKGWLVYFLVDFYQFLMFRNEWKS